MKDIEKLMEMMRKHKLDQINVEGLQLWMSKHETPMTPISKSSTTSLSEEDILFHSA